MITVLRQHHLTVFLGLALALPTLIVVALAARSSLPTSAVTPVAPRHDLGAALARIAFDDGPGGHVVHHVHGVVIELESPLDAPGVVAYHLPPGADSLRSEGVVLLGGLSGERPNALPLPEDTAGSIWLYSLGHGETLARIPLADSVR